MKQQSPSSLFLLFRMTSMAAAIAPAVLVASCSTARLSTPSVALPAAYESAAAASTAQGPQALDQWWRLFDDPSLPA
jgi:hypothetical protein